MYDCKRRANTSLFASIGCRRARQISCGVWPRPPELSARHACPDRIYFQEAATDAYFAAWQRPQLLDEEVCTPFRPRAEVRFSTHVKATRVVGAVGLAVASALAFNTTQAQQPGVHRTDLQRHELSIPGWEAVQVRVDIDPGMVAPGHRHPGEEVVYVLEGSLEYRLAGKPPVTLKTGDVLFIPAGVVHSARNVGRDNGAELATYIVEKGKPLVEVVK